MGKTKRPAKDRRPVKVAVEVEDTPVEEVETPVDTVAENENSEVEEAVSINTPAEEVKAPETEDIKVWTEEELVILPRAELRQALNDIKAGKARCKQRHE